MIIFLLIKEWRCFLNAVCLCICVEFLCFVLTYVCVFFCLQKLKDGEERVIKKRKKKDGTLEEKKPRKNRVSKQGWVWVQCGRGLWTRNEKDASAS